METPGDALETRRSNAEAVVMDLSPQSRDARHSTIEYEYDQKTFEEYMRCLQEVQPLRVFADELTIELPPNATGCELYMRDLSVADCLEDGKLIMERASRFGDVKDLYLLRHDGQPTGQGYVRFSSSTQARAFFEAYGACAGEDEIFSWSVSERLQAPGDGMSVLGSIDQSFLQCVAEAAKVKSLWLLAEGRAPVGVGPKAPKPQAKQLHFCSDCKVSDLPRLQLQLQKALSVANQPKEAAGEPPEDVWVLVGRLRDEAMRLCCCSRVSTSTSS
ncbi:PKAR [Symbiodinium sp. CCMP2592]|nr:PKAR [Symbiodinium sp. CCMP2592]